MFCCLNHHQQLHEHSKILPPSPSLLSYFNHICWSPVPSISMLTPHTRPNTRTHVSFLTTQTHSFALHYIALLCRLIIISFKLTHTDTNQISLYHHLAKIKLYLQVRTTKARCSLTAPTKTLFLFRMKITTERDREREREKHSF